jgi:uncharacterized protein
MSTTKSVLITGGSGLIGTRLTTMLTEKGYRVTHLSHSQKKTDAVKVYQWDPEKKFIEEEAVKSADYIIHLAGANVAEGRWTSERKKEIIDSRVLTTALLRETLFKGGHHVKAFISASGIGIYGADTGSKLINENETQGSDFLARVTKLWESEVDKIYNEVEGIRVVKLRTGIVLSQKGGALPKLTMPVKLGVGAPLASGKQYVSWIHIDDLCRMYIHAIENEHMSGAYNAVGPDPLTNKDLTNAIAKELGRPTWMPAVPEFALKLALGQMAEIVAGGNNISNEKITKAGFTYTYPALHGALHDLL